MLLLMVAALAVNSTCAAQPPHPISPANIPAQVPSKSDRRLSIYTAMARVNGLEEDYRHKAVAVLSKLKGIRYVELAPEGIVWGYTESERWTALILPCDNECVIHLSFISWNKISKDLEGERYRIAESIVKAELDYKLPTQFGKRDLELEKKLPAFFWQLEVRQVDSTTKHFRYFSSVAELIMEKYGYDATAQPNTSNKDVVYGDKQIDDVQLIQSVTMLDNKKGKSLCFLFIGVAADQESAASDTRVISNSIIKLLFD